MRQQIQKETGWSDEQCDALANYGYIDRWQSDMSADANKEDIRRVFEDDAMSMGTEMYEDDDFSLIQSALR